jgi:hypothetical protein
MISHTLRCVANRIQPLCGWKFEKNNIGFVKLAGARVPRVPSSMKTPGFKTRDTPNRYHKITTYGPQQNGPCPEKQDSGKASTPRVGVSSKPQFPTMAEESIHILP